jgi:hypothetical protein
MTREPKDYEVTFWLTTLVIAAAIGVLLSLGAALLLVLALGYAIWFTAAHGLTPFIALFFAAVTAGAILTGYAALRRRERHHTYRDFGPHFTATAAHTHHGEDLK